MTEKPRIAVLGMKGNEYYDVLAAWSGEAPRTLN